MNNYKRLKLPIQSGTIDIKTLETKINSNLIKARTKNVHKNLSQRNLNIKGLS